MFDYYEEKLSALRLQQVYALATPAVKRYLEAEIRFVRERLQPTDRVLELGCGYGRVLKALAYDAAWLCGIDTAFASLKLAAEDLVDCSNVALCRMNAVCPGFKPHSFDVVICIQNGISAFRADPAQLLSAAVAVVRPRGLVLFSSYAEAFWNERLEWFRIQAANGLIGEIDEGATGNGVIVCKDGFRAETFGPQDFMRLTASLGLAADIREVAAAAVFCEIHAPPSP